MKKPLLLIAGLWLLTVHLALAVALLRPHWLPDMGWRLGLAQPEPTAYVAERNAYLAAMDQAAGPAKLVLIGDSHSELIDPATLPRPARVMAAGGNTIRNIAGQIGGWSSLAQAENVALWAGYNDLARRSVDEIVADFRTALDSVPDGSLTFALSPVPVRDADANQAVLALRIAYREACEQVQNCRWVDIATPLSAPDGTLGARFDSGDGIHLAPPGSRKVAAIIAAAAKDADDDRERSSRDAQSPDR